MVGQQPAKTEQAARDPNADHFVAGFSDCSPAGSAPGTYSNAVTGSAG